MTDKQVSIVIAMRNEEGMIESCLSSFYKQTIPKDQYEIIVVDGSSTDQSVSAVEHFQQTHPDLEITLLPNPKKIQSAGWNIGFVYSMSKYVVMMGSHTTVEDNFLEQNLAAHQEFDVACTGGLIKAIGLNSKSRSIAYAFNSRFGSGNAKYWSGTEQEKVETVAFGMYKRAAVKEIGAIDETIIRGQDWEFNYRVTRRFGKLLFSPAIKSTYYSRTSFLKLWKRQYMAGFWKIYIIRKHPSSMLLRHFIPMLFAFVLVASLLLVLSGLTMFPLLGLAYLYLPVSWWSAYKVCENKPDASFFYTELAFIVIHTAYGIGGLFGVLKFLGADGVFSLLKRT